MERFTFRSMNLADIAAAVGKPATAMRLTTNADGSIEIETPDLTAAKRSQLLELFTSRGFVEDTG